MMRTGRGAITACLLAGCTTAPPGPPSRPLINHVVLFRLEDPAAAAELIGDCNTRIAMIPGVASYWAGRPLEPGRALVDGDYDVAMCIGFDTEDAYARYVDHPDHQDLVARWVPRLKWLRVHDVLVRAP
jgi:hypothetical protein